MCIAWNRSPLQQIQESALPSVLLAFPNRGDLVFCLCRDVAVILAPVWHDEEDRTRYCVCITHDLAVSLALLYCLSGTDDGVRVLSLGKL